MNQQEFDLNNFRVNQDESGIQQPIVDPEISEPIDFSKYAVEVDETTGEMLTRGTVRSGARAIESILGIPGDIAQFTKSVSNKIPKIFKDEEPNFVQKAGQKLLLSLPTSNQLKEVSSWLTSGYTDPKSATEEFTDEIASLAGALSVPMKDPSKIKGLMKAVGKSTAVKGARAGAEQLGADVKGQTAVELGTLFAVSLLGKSAPDQLIRDKYKEAEKLLPKGVMANTKQLSKDLIDVRRELSKGVSTPTKKQVINTINELEAKASTGAMEAEELIQSYRDINEVMTSKGLFNELSKAERKVLKFRYDKVKNALNKSVQEFGENQPLFLQEWREANQAYATLEQSKKIQNWVSGTAGQLPKKVTGTILGELILGTLAGQPALGAKIAAGTAAGFGGLKAGEVLFRISNNKTLRNHYINALNAAAKEDTAAFIKSVNAFEKDYKKLEKKEPIEFQSLEEFRLNQ